jgi:hypothetical protein
MSLMRDVVCCVTRPIVRGVTESTCCDDPGPDDGFRLILESGDGFLLLETGYYLLLE